MKQVQLQEAADGDTLARDLTTETGAMILGSGAQLSSSMIARLGKMGIDSVCIEDGDSAAASQEQLALLDKRFAGTDDNEYLQEMKKIVTAHVAGT